MKTILVFIDFDAQTKTFIDKTIELLRGVSGAFKIIHVAAPDPDFVSYSVGLQYIRDFRADELKKEHKELQGYAEELNNSGLEAESLLIQGATVANILEEVTNLEADLIVLGSHHHGFLYKSFVGSTKDGVLQ